ncbi:MAG: L-threonylcarbamoyladenylate synthase [Blastocatellia bacterium]|nr:L-threonylcarbamoyladenylate synthase [Blastocatellia bacterium]MCS7157680.1 L-threonylcarbamoyladenylate synthase [Blastocatellia bacterium]MDW8167051.1 L-threonylcarbamoyladenylate synthase [Acidobacteriota bacterium]MDW8257155.1 L-threonylcarbamoyladenylate synthase [Acidobacteriota bacterium]
MVRVTPDAPEPEAIARAAAVLRRGGLVAFPTETVYGLGADALNPRAVARIFAVKGRPADNPLIVHIAWKEQLHEVARAIPESAWHLAERFWPGPLTLVLPRQEQVPLETTGGLETVAVRMPDSAIALALIRALGRPIAAPSANLSGRPSPTAAEHVYEDLHGRIELILDGGPTRIGVESTVLDLTTIPPTILRPGGVSPEQLRPILGEVRLGAEATEARRSPGTRYRHYRPRAEVILIERWEEAKHRPLVERLAASVRRLGYIGRDRGLSFGDVEVRLVELPPDPQEYARRLFAIFREMDQCGTELIIVEGIEETDLGLAVMDRLRRAASRVL